MGNESWRYRRWSLIEATGHQIGAHQNEAGLVEAIRERALYSLSPQHQVRQTQAGAHLLRADRRNWSLS